MPERHDPSQAGRAGFETSDVPPVRVVVIGLGLAAGTGLIALLLFGLSQLLGSAVETSPPGPLATVEREPPAPRLQIEPALELEEMQARDALILESYGWIDRDVGIARIPIERAIAILAERGWPNPVEGPSAAEAAPVADQNGGGAR